MKTKTKTAVAVQPAVEPTESINDAINYLPECYDVIVITDDAALVSEIHQLHGEINGAALTVANHAIRIGQLLTAKKAKLKHGLFGEWLAQNLRVGNKQCNTYMRCFAAWEADNDLNIHGLTLEEIAKLAPSQRDDAKKPKKAKVEKPDPDDGDPDEDEERDHDGQDPKDLQIETLRGMVKDLTSECETLTRQVQALKTSEVAVERVKSEDLDVLVEYVIAGTSKGTVIEILASLGAKFPDGFTPPYEVSPDVAKAIQDSSNEMDAALTGIFAATSKSTTKKAAKKPGAKKSRSLKVGDNVQFLDHNFHVTDKNFTLGEKPAASSKPTPFELAQAAYKQAKLDGATEEDAAAAMDEAYAAATAAAATAA